MKRSKVLLMKNISVVISLLLGALLWIGSSSHNDKIESIDIAPYQYASWVRPANLELLNEHEKFYKERIARDPRGGLDHAALASLYISKMKLTGDLTLADKAEALAKTSLKNFPKFNALAQIVLAKVEESRHNFTKAIDMAKEVLKQNLVHLEAISIIITSSLGHGQIEQASSYADHLVKINPCLDSYALKALVLSETGNIDAAIENFTLAIKSETAEDVLGSAWVRTLIARLYIERNAFELAREYIRSALKINPNYHLALAYSADIEFESGNLDKADKLYSLAFMAKEEAPYLIRQARLKKVIGDFNSAQFLESKAEKIIREKMNNGPYGDHNELAQLLIDRGEPNDLKEALVVAKRNSNIRQNSESYFLLAQALTKNKQWQQAEDALLKAADTGFWRCDYIDLANLIKSKKQITNLTDLPTRRCSLNKYAKN